MKKAPRNFLFALVLLVFVVSAPILILYALGYRYDSDSHKLRKTATIGLEFESQSLKVYFDDVFIADKKDSVIIPGVTSALHRITVTKNDAFSWEQNVETSPGVVTWLSNILLYRANLGKSFVTDQKDNVLAATPSTTQNSFALVNENPVGSGIKTIQIRDRKTQNITTSASEKAIKDAAKNIDTFSYEKMFFTQNDSWLIIPVVLTDKTNSYVVMNTKDGSSYSLDTLLPANTTLFADANDQSVYFYLESGKRKLLNLQTKKLSDESETLYSFHKAFTTYTIERTSSDCTLNETLDLIATKKTITNFPCGNFEVKISPNSNFIVSNLTTNDAFFFDTRAKAATPLEKKATNFTFASKPNAGDVVVYLVDSEIRAFASDTSEKTLISRSSKPIQGLLASTLGTHAYSVSGDVLTASEITFDRTPVAVSWDLEAPLPFLLPASTEQTILLAEREKAEIQPRSLYEVTLYDL